MDEYNKRYDYNNNLNQHQKEINNIKSYNKDELNNIKNNIISDYSKYKYLQDNNINKGALQEYNKFINRINEQIKLIDIKEKRSNLRYLLEEFINKYTDGPFKSYPDGDLLLDNLEVAPKEDIELFKNNYQTDLFKNLWTNTPSHKGTLSKYFSQSYVIKKIERLLNENYNVSSSDKPEQDEPDNDNITSEASPNDNTSDNTSDKSDDEEQPKAQGPNVYEIEMQKFKSITPNKINKKIYELYHTNNNKDIDGILYLLFKKYYEELEPKDAKKKIMKLLSLFDKKYRLDKFNTRKQKKFYKSDYFESDKFNNKVEQIKGSGILSSILGAIGLNANVLNARGSGLISGLIGGLINGVKSLFGGNADCLNGIDFDKLKLYDNEVQDGIIHYILNENNKNLDKKDLLKLYKECLIKYDKEYRNKLYNKRINNKFYDDDNLNKVVGGFPFLALAGLIPGILGGVSSIISSAKGKGPFNNLLMKGPIGVHPDYMFKPKLNGGPNTIFKIGGGFKVGENSNNLNVPAGSAVMSIQDLERIKKEIK